MSLIDELFEDESDNKKIIKTFDPKETLSDDIFDYVGNTYKLKKEIRKKLIEISNDFIESLGVDFFIHDVVLTGSIANFNWSKYSDIDLHLKVDMEDIEGANSEFLKSVFKEFFDSKKNIWNNKHDVTIKGYDVEVYVEDINETHISSGVYSILNNKWIVEPSKANPKIDDRKILEKANYYESKLNKINKLKDRDKIIDAIKEFFDKIKKFRQCGLEKGGEYSYENLTFKLLRRNGVLNMLSDIKDNVVDKKLSLKESPDHIYDGEAHYYDDDAIPFGIYKNVMMIGYNENLTPIELYEKLYTNFILPNKEFFGYKAKDMFDDGASIHPKIPAFYQALKDLGIETTDVDIDRPFGGFWRTMFKYSGRLWYDHKIISFWEFPKTDEELLKVLDMIKEKMKLIYHKDVNFNDYLIEVMVAKGTGFDDDVYELIPITKYIGGYEDTSKEKMEAPHLLPPEVKAQTSQMQAVKKANIERNAKLEKGWDSLAQRNFYKNKGIAENEK